MAALKDVARLAGVSVATVSYVINGTKSVSPEVTARVLQAAEALGYRPNRTARALRTGRSEAIGLVLPDLTNPYFPALAQTVERRARELGFALFLIDSANDPEAERAGLQSLAERNVDGVIWAPVADDPQAQYPFPIVALDRTIHAVDCVSADHRMGGELAADFVNRLGHRRIGLLSGPQALTSARDRREGFVARIAEGCSIVWEVEVPFSLPLPNRAVERLLQCDVTLVVGGNDVIAIGALRALRGAGVSVPAQVSVIGFDDIPWSELVEPPLSTIRQPLEAIGDRAVELLRARMHNPRGPVRHELLPVELVSRGSAAKARRDVREKAE